MIYLKEGKLPEDKKLAWQVRMRVIANTMIANTLYRRGHMLSLLKCISRADAYYILLEIQEGVCGSHSGSRMLAYKVVKSGYYWPHMNEDSANLVRNCDSANGSLG